MQQNFSFSSQKTSIDTQEIHQFGKIAPQWWDENGPFKPLHQLNPTRMQFIRDALMSHFQRPLTGLSVLDIGCGGGLVAECLARLGANVTGIDASVEAIEVAKAHAKESGLEITYRTTSVEDLRDEGAQFQAVLALEIVEHVADVPFFLKACVDVVEPRGAFLLSTLNRTWKAWMMAIVGAEYVLRWLPRGTHDWSKFLAPSEVAGHLRPLGFTPYQLSGMTFDPLRQTWGLSPRDLDVNYLAAFCVPNA